MMRMYHVALQGGRSEAALYPDLCHVTQCGRRVYGFGTDLENGECGPSEQQGVPGAPA